jgi:hypothetical protein
MERNEPERRREPRKTAERDASQPVGGQPMPGDEDASLQKPEDTPSFLTARELQARDPAKGEDPAVPPKRKGGKTRGPA